ncbi:MAG TPA: vitamin K epoxide reductase family protein [Aggregatilineales bacterium]|nr:vitamin K epoxide reductase family protein [Aggregatilineales bacterium]
MNTTDSVEQSQSRGFSISLRVVSFIILAAALFVSGYLTYQKYSENEVTCPNTGKFDCGTVLNSAYAEMGGVPISLWGFVTNLVMVTLLVLETRVEFFKPFGPTLVFGVILFAFLFSIYLVYLQAFVIKAYCIWCLSHEALMTLMFITTSIRLRNHLQES